DLVLETEEPRRPVRPGEQLRGDLVHAVRGWRGIDDQRLADRNPRGRECLDEALPTTSAGPDVVDRVNEREPPVPGGQQLFHGSAGPRDLVRNDGGHTGVGRD